MRRVPVLLVMFLVVVVGAFHGVSAQPGDGAPKREKMRQRIEDLRKVKLLDILDLKGDQVERFFAVYNRHQDRFHEQQMKIDAAARDLQGAIGRGASDAELGEKTLALRNLIRDLEKTIESRFDELKPILSTKQYAQYVVFEARFRDELQRMIMDRMKKMRRDGLDE